MAQRLEVEGGSEVVRAALSLLRFYLEKCTDGFDFQLVKEGMVYQFELPLD